MDCQLIAMLTRKVTGDSVGSAMTWRCQSSLNFSKLNGLFLMAQPQVRAPRCSAKSRHRVAAYQARSSFRLRECAMGYQNRCSIPIFAFAAH